MPIALTCPKCRAAQTVPDESAGQPVRCPTCQAEFPAGPPTPKSAKWFVLLGILALGLILIVVSGVGFAAYHFIFRSTATDFTDPNGVFSAQFPDPPTTKVVSKAVPLKLLWGEELCKSNAWGKEYSVAVLDGLNDGDQLYGPATRDMHINAVIVIATTNAGGKMLMDRPAVHEGHTAREVVFVRHADDKLTALRVLAGERHVLRLAVTGSGHKDRAAEFLDRAAEFFDGVKVGPKFGAPIVDDPLAISAADLAAAYRADAGAADGKYKGHWLRITGSVREVSKDGTDLLLDAGKSVVLVRRAPKARRSVPVRGAGAEFTATAQCRGLDPSNPAGPRILLEDAIVARPRR